MYGLHNANQCKYFHIVNIKGNKSQILKTLQCQIYQKFQTQLPKHELIQRIRANPLCQGQLNYFII